MYDSIVCGFDGSELSTKALNHALLLAKTLDAKLLVVTVTDPSVILAPGAEMMMVDTSTVMADLEAAKADSAKGILGDAEQLAAEAGVAIETLHLPGYAPADGIIETSKTRGAQLIVMGSHGRRGLGRLLLGSQASEVLAHASVPVLIIK